MPVARHLAHHLGIGDGHAADHEERRLGAVLVERLQDGARIGTQRPVIEGQHDLAVFEKVVAAAGDAAEQRAAGGVDLDHARQAEDVVMRGAGGDRRRALRCARQ